MAVKAPLESLSWAEPPRTTRLRGTEYKDLCESQICVNMSPWI